MMAEADPEDLRNMQEEQFEMRSEVIDLLQLLKASGYAATEGRRK